MVDAKRCKHSRVRLTEEWILGSKKWKLRLHCEVCSKKLNMNIVNPWQAKKYLTRTPKRVATNIELKEKAAQAEA